MASSSNSLVTVLEIWHCIFDYLPVQDLFRLSRSCSMMRELIKQYWSSRLKVTHALRPFFKTSEEIDWFLQMMRRTGAIVSGSVALQLFERTYYEESDLDVYVNDERFDEVHHWLSEVGFQKVEQDESKQRRVVGDSYPAIEEIEKVEGYMTSSSKVLQLITTKHSPVLAVLNFHSTCVMNFFTPFSAYALYPISTFLKRRSLVCGAVLPLTCAALIKYETRGWTPIFSMTAEQLLRQEGSDLKTNTRRVGDALCWVHRQESEAFVPMGEDVIWQLQYTMVNIPETTEEG